MMKPPGAQEIGPPATFGAGGWGVRVTAPSRLSFGLIDLNGSGGRRNGMASFSVREPSFRAVVRPGTQARVVLDAHSAEHATDIQTFLARLRDDLGGPPSEIVVESGIPPHHGFGSKTTTLLALGRAYALLCNVNVTTDYLAALGGRANTSGGSANLIDSGGFIVDGGHANPSDFDRDPRHYLLPTRFATPARKPPVLVRLPFPPWPILIFVARGLHVRGQVEREWFQSIVPAPVDEVRKTAHLVFLNLAPAIAESDYVAFCTAHTRLTQDTYFKKGQIALQSETVQALLREAAARPDVDTVGMSVHGPSCYLFTREPRSVVAWMEQLVQDNLVESFWFTSAQNVAARFEGVPCLNE